MINFPYWQDGPEPITREYLEGLGQKERELEAILIDPGCEIRRDLFASVAMYVALLGPDGVRPIFDEAIRTGTDLFELLRKRYREALVSGEFYRLHKASQERATTGAQTTNPQATTPERTGYGE